MDFICGRCEHSCKRKSDLKKHLQNVKVCEAKTSDVERSVLISQLERKYNENAISCQWCDKKFNHASNYSTHKKTCKKRPILEDHDNSQNGNEKMISELLNVLKSIDSTMKTLQSNTNTTNPIVNNNCNNTYNIIGQQNVNINAFGNESLSHITNDKMMSYIKNRDIVELIKEVNFNPTVPENHNVKRITSSKDYYKNQF
jgi:hypothetical protein